MDRIPQPILNFSNEILIKRQLKGKLIQEVSQDLGRRRRFSHEAIVAYLNMHRFRTELASSLRIELAKSFNSFF